MATRRLLLGALTFVAAAPGAFAQSATERALDDFVRYLDASAALFGEFALGLRSADARTLSSPASRQALEEVSQALRQQAMANGAVVDFVSMYLRRAQDAAQADAALTEEGRAQAEVALISSWDAAVREVRRTSVIVQRVTAIVDSTPELDRVLSPERRLALSDTLAAREDLLGRLAEMPRPRTSAELDRLALFNQRYQRLIDALQSIRVELRRILQG